MMSTIQKAYNEDVASIINDPGNILIVGDESLQKLLIPLLLGKGYNIETAQNYKEALTLLKKAPCAVLLCQHKDEVKLNSFLKKAQELNSDAVRILFVENEDNAISQALMTMNKGAADHILLKPWNEELLNDLLRVAIGKYKFVKEKQILQQLYYHQHKKLKDVNETLQRDLTLGVKIHQNLLSGRVPKNVPSLIIEEVSKSSSEIDGDFFDFYRPCPGILDIVLGDVMGKGIAAALVGTAIKSELTRFALPISAGVSYDRSKGWNEDILSPIEIITLLHETMVNNLLKLEFFSTLFYGRFNLQKRQFTYLDCGATKPLHYIAKEKRVELLKGENFPLGIVKDTSYSVNSTTYAPDDVFIFYSDGVTESRAPDDSLYGIEFLKDLVQEYAHLPPHELLGLIEQSVYYFTKKNQLEDDLTIIVVKIGDAELMPDEPEKTVVKFRSDLSQLKPVREFVASFCNRAPGDTENLTTLMQLAINEIFCNIVTHSYKNDNSGVIIIEYKLVKEGIFIEILDQGMSIEPKNVPHPDMSGDRIHGFGWYIVKKIVDELNYVPKSSANGWNHIQLFKKYIYEEKTMKIQSEVKEDVLVISPLEITIDGATSNAFKHEVTNLITQNNLSKVIIDLHDIEFVDSAGLASFLSILKLLNLRGGTLKLCNLKKPVITLFQLVSMDQIFDVYKTLDEARHSF